MRIVSSDSEHVAICECEWAVSTRGIGVDRRSVETVAQTHADRCGPVTVRRVEEPFPDGPLADADGESINTFGESS